MSGRTGSAAPRAPGDAPPWAVALVRDLVDWVQQLFNGPMRAQVFTVAQLLAMDATKCNGWIVICSNEAGGRTIATCDGVTFKRVKDGATVS